MNDSSPLGQSKLPYPGLRPFKRSESDIFFGRDEHTEQLIDKLKTGNEHFLAVVGLSGCGKSSLVRTGLLAGLELGLAADIGIRWRMAELHPDDRPFSNLASALLADGALKKEYLTNFPEKIEDKEAVSFLEASLSGGPLSIHELLEGTPLPENTNLLIVVDQFEELFRQFASGDTNIQKAFVALLLESSRHKQVYVVITMRSDFIGDCAKFYGLPEAISQGLFLTPRLTREQLRDAIELPVQMFEDEVAPELVNSLLNEMGDDPDQLPLMQHALMRMWRRARASMPGKAVLSLKHYEEMGRLDAALSKHADEIYAVLRPEQQKIAEILFRNLSERSGVYRDTRRPVKLEQVAKLAEVSWEKAAGVVDEFRRKSRNFLTPPPNKKLMSDTVVDIIHESLIRRWKRLSIWADEEAKSADMYRDLKKVVLLWMERDKSEAALWTDLALEFALQWRAHEQPTVAWAQRYDGDAEKFFPLVMEFVEKSQQKKQRKEQEVETARKQKEELEKQREKAKWAQKEYELANRAQQQERQKFGMALFALFMAIIFTIWAFWERDQAREAKGQAEEAKKSRTLALFNSRLSHAKLEIQGENYADARQELSETSRLDKEIPGPLRHARDSLAWFSKLMGDTPRHVYRKAGAPLFDIAINSSGKLLAAAGENGTLTVFGMDGNKQVQRLKGLEGHVRSVAFHPRDKWLAAGGDDERIILWAVSPDKRKISGEIRRIEAPGQVWTLAVDANGKHLASAGVGNTVSLWNAETGLSVKELAGHQGDIGDLAFSPAGTVLAGASYDGSAYLWDVNTGQSLRTLTGHSGRVEHVSFCSDEKRLATAGQDKTIRIWELGSGNEPQVLRGHKDKVFSSAFMEGGQYLISGGADSVLRFWDIESGVTLRVLQGHHAWVNALSVRGQSIFSAGNDGMVMRWDLRSPYLHITDLAREPASAAIAPDGNSVALGSADGSLHLYSLPGAKLLWESKKGHGEDIQRLAFSPDSTLLASASLDSTVKLWQIKQGKAHEQKTISGHTDGISAVTFSPDGQMLATAGYDGQVGLFTIGAENPVFFDAQEGKEVNSVVFDADGTQLLSAGDNGVRLWNIKENPPLPVEKFPHIQEQVMWADSDPQGQSFATAGRKPVVNIYSFPDGKLQHRLFGHGNAIWRAKYSPDGHQLATVSADATVRFWDLSSGAELFALRLPALPNPPAPLWDFDFRCTPTGCWIAVPLTRGKLVLYELGRIYDPALHP